MKTATPTVTPDLTPAGIRRFQRRVLDHYRRHGRALPWRGTDEPYRILVSEVMLQQTQVDRVAPKYLEFMRRFPNPAALARAPLRQVLAAWSGLGYNRRARALKSCAEMIAGPLCGRVPDTPEALTALPGIGPYTARAVCVFAYNQPQVVIETNVRSVYIHFFFPGQSRVRDADLLPLIERTLYRRDPRRWYNALMDYGVMLKKTCGNPSRTSAHHVRQSPFKGSNREVRGMVLKALLEESACTEAGLIRAAGMDAARVRAALRQLVDEGLVIKQGRRLALP